MNLGSNEDIIARYCTKEEAEKRIGKEEISINFSVEKEEKAFMESLYGNHKDVSKLKKLYEYTDLRNTAIDDIIVCQKGCAFCCKIPVEISELEVKYIERNTNHKRQDIQNINKNEYCPFLNQEKGECSIYEYRPIACRTFFTLDNPKYCENKDEKHAVIQLDGDVRLSSMYSLLLIKTNTSPLKKDIRNYFS